MKLKTKDFICKFLNIILGPTIILFVMFFILYIFRSFVVGKFSIVGFVELFFMEGKLFILSKYLRFLFVTTWFSLSTVYIGICLKY